MSHVMDQPVTVPAVRRLAFRSNVLTAVVLVVVAALVAAPGSGRAQVASGRFASAPVFNASGMAFAVFGGGSVEALESASLEAGATGVWAQAGGGAYQLLIVRGPSFLTAPFAAAFPVGFVGATAVTLVRSGEVLPASTPTPTPTNAPTTFEEAVAAQALQFTNQERLAHGLTALSAHSLLHASATTYAALLVQVDPYLADVAGAHTHDGQPWDRATRAGYVWSTLAENVAVASAGSAPEVGALAKLIVDGWMGSPPHRANILTPGFVDTSIGCVTGKPASAPSGLDFAVVCVAAYGTLQ